MSQHIPEETIQEVLHRAEIVEVIGDYVQLSQRGTNAKGLCPFHNEKTPSFTVSPAKGLFYCFGCQASGNVFRFLMQHEHLTFPDAVRLLADRYGIRIPETASSPQQEALHELYKLHEAAAVFFQQHLLQAAAAQPVRTYCRQRHISGEVAKRFGLGYAPQGWEGLARAMQQQGFAQELLVHSGLVVARDHQRGVYDRFRHRLMFPIYDRRGRPVAFGGRALDGPETQPGPKYLNSPETPIFQKNRTLYGFHLAHAAMRQHGCAIIVEGYTDVIACHRQGVAQAVGTLGTALTASHVELIKGVTKEVALVFDADAAGGAAAERAIGLFLDAGMRVRIVELPAGDDPDSFLQHSSGESFLQRVSEAGTFLEFLLMRAQRVHDLQTPAGRADCVARILPLLAKIENEVERWGYVTLLADKLGMPPDVLQRQMQPRSGSRVVAPRASATRREPVTLSTPGPREEYQLVQMLCHNPRLFEDVRGHVTAQDFRDVTLGALFTLLESFATQQPETVFPHIVQMVDEPAQAQVLTKMAMEPFDTDPAACAKALHDCLERIRQRPGKDKRWRVIEQLRSVHDDAERERLLHEFQSLQQRRVVGSSVK